MRIVNINTWPRRQHFELYKSFDYPHFSLCAPVDITETLQRVKEQKISLTVALVYTLARAANDIVNFRYRIRTEGVVEHDLVHPSTTILNEGELFSFCTIPYQIDFELFSAVAAYQIEQVRQNLVLSDEPGQDDLLFMSSIPWVSFTGMSHPIHMHPVDSIPRITWGKFYDQEARRFMPLSVQAHHALMDAYHVGLYFESVQEYLLHPVF